MLWCIMYEYINTEHPVLKMINAHSTIGILFHYNVTYMYMYMYLYGDPVQNN